MIMTDLILYNANIITLDPNVENVQLVAVADGRIQSVADDEALKDLKRSDTQVIDCCGKTVLPGFCDPHFHLQSTAAKSVTLDVSPQANVYSISDLQDQLRINSKKLAPGAWLRASGYHEFYLAEGRHPTRGDLDKAAPNHPVKLTHQSRHAHVLNSLALELSGISISTSDPPGGLIDRSADTGEPTGILFEMNDFLSRHAPPLEENEFNRGIKLVNQNLLSLGITSIHDASSHNGIKQWTSLCSWKEKNKFLPRVNMMLGLNGFNRFEQRDFFCLINKDQLRLSGVKIILDETMGQLYPPQKELNRLVLKIHQAGLQVAIHAIGETAVESACLAIEHALEKAPKLDHRHRIEHCSVSSPSLAKRLAISGIMVVTQPAFIYYNGDRYLKTVSNHEIQHLYPIGTLVKNGVDVAGSSDSPIVEPNPLVGIQSAVTRKTKTGNTVSAKERINPMAALRMYTSEAAKASFEEAKRGSITAGKLADLVVLNGDPTKLLPAEIKDLEVEMTILNGNIVWNKQH
jgi:predicted amidohydrolase YtcJ